MPPLLTAFAPPAREAAPRSEAVPAGDAPAAVPVVTVRLQDVVAIKS